MWTFLGLCTSLDRARNSPPLMETEDSINILFKMSAILPCSDRVEPSQTLISYSCKTRFFIMLRSREGLPSGLFPSGSFFFFFFFFFLFFFYLDRLGCMACAHSELINYFRNYGSYRQLVGLLGRVASSSQGRYLHGTIQTQKQGRQICLEWDSNPRSQCLSGRQYVMPWKRGQDRLPFRFTVSYFDYISRFPYAFHTSVPFFCICSS
jgi:hypothetical protein